MRLYKRSQQEGIISIHICGTLLFIDSTMKCYRGLFHLFWQKTCSSSFSYISLIANVSKRFINAWESTFEWNWSNLNKENSQRRNFKFLHIKKSERRWHKFILDDREIIQPWLFIINLNSTKKLHDSFEIFNSPPAPQPTLVKNEHCETFAELIKLSA
jgi:hypothetical protein